jgi:hypothetical protein
MNHCVRCTDFKTPMYTCLHIFKQTMLGVGWGGGWKKDVLVSMALLAVLACGINTCPL